jgi:hypothetical protein
MQFVGMFMIYVHVKFHVPSLNGSLVVTVGLNTKEIFRAAILFYILQSDVIKKSCIFFSDPFSYIILCPYIKIC